MSSSVASRTDGSSSMMAIMGADGLLSMMAIMGASGKSAVLHQDMPPGQMPRHCTCGENSLSGMVMELYLGLEIVSSSGLEITFSADGSPAHRPFAPGRPTILLAFSASRCCGEP